jgi:hypothetical protein
VEARCIELHQPNPERAGSTYSVQVNINTSRAGGVQPTPRVAEHSNSTGRAPPRYTLSVSAHAPPTTRAKKLVSYANVLAISSLDDDLLQLYPPLLNAFRSRSLIGRLMWDFFATVAGVGVAFTEIADTVPEAEQEALRGAIADALTAWNPRGYTALADFLNFVRQGVTSGTPLPLLIGTWIIRNVLPDHRTAAADLDLFSNAGSAIGMVFLHAFHGWWQKKAARREPRGPADAHRVPPRPLV